MTREEEKREAARRYATHDVDTDETDFYGNYVKKEDFVLPEYNAFIEGCKWSDANPKSPWVKAEDRLPAKGGHYLCMDENHNISVLVFVGDKWINTRTFADVPLEVVKYWMPIPELPKE